MPHSNYKVVVLLQILLSLALTSAIPKWTVPLQQHSVSHWIKAENALVWSNSGRPVRVRVDGGLTDAECKRVGCQSTYEKQVCVTPGCVQAAARLLNSIDVTADPCKDFYQYACGKWIEKNIIPEDKSRHGVFDELIENVNVILKRLLENPKPSLVATVNKARNVYKACMDKSQIEKRGVLPALELFRTTNIWPAVLPKHYSDATYDLVASIANVGRIGDSALLSVNVDTDYKHPTERILSLDQAALGMPSRDYLLRSTNDTVVQAYYQYMLSVAAILDAEKPTSMSAAEVAASRARIESELPAVLDFEIALANITAPKELRRDPVRLYNKMTLAELAKRAPGFDWLRLVNLWLKDSGLQVTSSESVIVAEPEYMKKFAALVAKTPLRTVANYLGWRTIKGLIFDLDDSLQEARLRYSTALTGVTKDPPRWKSCVARASGAIPMGIGRLYVDNEFDPKSKTISKTLISNLRVAFDEQLDRIDWLGTVERKLSHEKLAAIIEQIGYDDKLLNDTWLNNHHALNVGNADDHFGNVLANDQASIVFQQRRLREPIDRYEWEVAPSTVNAFYNPTVNSIMFVAGILQSPFFSRTQPMSLNFGSIGFVMGHEIVHGFDDQGRQFDKTGMLTDWWLNATVASFVNRTQCVVDYYSNYTVDEVGLHVNGRFTLGENLADMGGLNAAYRAFQRYLDEAGGQEPALPGLQQLSNKQLFFLGAASVWCGAERPERLKQSILTDTHSPGRFRVIGPLSQMPEFSSAFNCPLGSPMNPVEKCRVW